MPTKQMPEKRLCFSTVLGMLLIKTTGNVCRPA